MEFKGETSLYYSKYDPECGIRVSPQASLSPERFRKYKEYGFEFAAYPLGILVKRAISSIPF